MNGQLDARARGPGRQVDGGRLPCADRPYPWPLSGLDPGLGRGFVPHRHDHRGAARCPGRGHRAWGATDCSRTFDARRRRCGKGAGTSDPLRTTPHRTHRNAGSASALHPSLAHGNPRARAIAELCRLRVQPASYRVPGAFSSRPVGGPGGVSRATLDARGGGGDSHRVAPGRTHRRVAPEDGRGHSVPRSRRAGGAGGLRRAGGGLMLSAFLQTGALHPIPVLRCIGGSPPPGGLIPSDFPLMKIRGALPAPAWPTWALLALLCCLAAHVGAIWFDRTRDRRARAGTGP